MGPLGAVVLACLAAAVLADDMSDSPHQQHFESIPGFCHRMSSFPLLPNLICSRTKFASTQASFSHLHPSWTRATSCIDSNNGTDTYCVFTSATFGFGRGISVFTTPDRAESMAQLPAFANSAQVFKNENSWPDLDNAPFKHVHVPGKDLGVVATRLIDRGALLMSEPAAVLVDYGAFDALDYSDVERLQTEAVHHLPPRLRERSLNLSVHGGTDHVDLVEKIMQTNTFEPGGDYDPGRGLYSLFPDIARLNHDCRPNANYWFDQDTLMQHVFATRTIVPGEEISVTYMEAVRLREQRQTKLDANWGFQCSCSLCSQVPELTEASDQRIKQIRNIRRQLEDYTTESAATPQMADLFVSLHEQERLHTSIYEAYVFAAIEWNGVGETWEAVRYARLGIEYGILSVGPMHRDVVAMQALVDDPRDHWSWMLRTSKRMNWDRMRYMSGQYMKKSDEKWT